MMGVTVKQYEGTPALIVDWDLELAATEQRATEAVRKP